MKRLILSTAAALAACFCLRAATGPTAQDVVDRICSEAFAEAHVGVLAVRLGERADTVAKHDASKLFIPASNLKLLTTGAALRALGPGFRYETTLRYSGEILPDGTLDGDLYICGGGDPTTAAPYESSMAAMTLFAKWKGILADAGIRSISGTVIGDGRLFPPEPNCDWSVEDAAFYYGAAAHGLNFCENAVTVETEEDPVVNNLPEYSCARSFCDYLAVVDGVGGYASIPVSRGPADISPEGAIRRDPLYFDEDEKALCPDSLKVLGRTLSPALSSIIADTNFESDNFYADALLKTIGLVKGGGADYSRAIDAELKILDGIIGQRARRIKIRDGSGLSRRNLLSPDYMVRFLTGMAFGPYFDVFLRSIPQPGSGTVYSRLSSAPSALKRRIHMKSGSMDGVKCFSGFILPESGERTADGTIAFCIFTNAIAYPSAADYKAIEEIIISLAN